MATAADVIKTAQAQLGKPYEWGDEGPLKFDCSGLMVFCFKANGITLPRTAAAQQSFCTPVDTHGAMSPGIAAPGMLVFWGKPAYHVGLMIGANELIAAPHTGDVVRTMTLYGNPTFGAVPGLGAGPSTGAIVGGDIEAGVGAVAGAVTAPLDQLAAIMADLKKPETWRRFAFIGIGMMLISFGVFSSVAPDIEKVASNVV